MPPDAAEHLGPTALADVDEGSLVRAARRPGEPHNRVADLAALAGVLASLKDGFLTFYLETGDVVLRDTDRRSQATNVSKTLS